MSKRFNYINTDKPEFMVDMSNIRNNNEKNIIMSWSEWDKGLKSKSQGFRSKSWTSSTISPFFNLDYYNSNGGQGLHRHEKGNSYKYKFQKPIGRSIKGDLNNDNMVLEEQRLQGGDVMGNVNLSEKRATNTLKFRNKATNKGINHGYGYFGSGQSKYEYQDRANKENNKNDYKTPEYDEEFISLSLGMKKNKLEYSDYRFTQATDGI